MRSRTNVGGRFRSALRELYEYRELIQNLVSKEYRAKYKGTFLGFLWSLVVPLVMVCVYSFAFGVIMRVSIPKFPIYLLTGLLPWTFFSGSLLSTVGVISSNANLVKKIYFPREILPLSSTLFNLIHFLLSFIILVPAVLLFRVGLQPVPLLFLPLAIVLSFTVSLGLALLVSAGNVFFRDVEHLLEVLLIAWFFLTPIIYEFNMVAGRVPRWLLRLYQLNPMVHVIDLYHDILYWGRMPASSNLLGASVAAVVCLLVGYAVFKRSEPRFAEEV
jgi:lipopolysaccharide transport system permease protein